MHFQTLLAALGAAHLAAALPQQQQIFKSPEQAVTSLLSSVEDTVQSASLTGSQILSGLVDGLHDAYKGAHQNVEHTMEGFDLVTLEEFPEHSLRIKSTSKLCDPSVKQVSGYLDVSDNKHLFFWFFESRNNPKKDPLTMWLNGGPGCSSSTGLLFELGPCAVAEEGKDTVINKYSWNEVSNMIFLDQPVNVGYSYSNGESVSSTEAAAEDVYAFMQLLYSKMPHLRELDFHLAAESYGGRYAPVIGSRIHAGNKKLDKKQNEMSELALANNNLVHVPLTSLLIGNGLSEPRTQFPSIPDFSCKPSPTAIFNEAQCADLRNRAPTCQRLLGYCYDNPTRLTCTPSLLYCWQMAGPIQNSGINPYDVRKKCDRNGEDGPLCYKQMGWIENYLNNPDVKAELGAPKDLKFESCNMQINQAFMFAGDGAHNSAALLPELLSGGIRVLIYAGDQDFMCNWIGNKRWPLELDTVFKEELNAKEDKPWTLIGAGNPHPVGEIRSAGSGAGNFTYARVYESGHMVPYDQPKAALDLVQRWLANTPLA